MNSPFSNILIYGLGLMGGSLALTLRKKFPEVKIHAVVRSTVSQKNILDRNLVDSVRLESEIQDSSSGFSWEEYDFILFGTPVHLIKNQVRLIPQDIPAVISDMGSTKKTIVEAVESYYGDREHNYVSSHPMCGSEQTGAEHAIDDLYQDKLCILTPVRNSNVEAKEKLRSFWEAVGMRTYELDDTSHDRILAYLSHSPHVISSVMVTWAERFVGEENKKSPQPIMGGGFRDMARIAGSNPEMWKAILQENHSAILGSLKNFREELDVFISSLEKGESGDWEEYFKKSKSL